MLEHGALLERLHQEVRYCVRGGRPLPNPDVYDRPWLRDAAMMGMVLQVTGELDLIRNWIQGLDDPFDRNNAGMEEPDNLGQALFLVSLVADHRHPLVPRIIETIPRFLSDEGHLVGSTDFGPKPVYQTKWLKYGLRALGLADPYVIPRQYDPYSALFWMDYRDEHVPGPPSIDSGNLNYPYLQWAEAHFHGTPPPVGLLELGGDWLTWEAEASQASYPAAGPRVCRPHSWHAAEAFLYLIEWAE